jgi:hypothetical protein
MRDLLRLIGLLALASGVNAQTQSAFSPLNPVSASATSSNAVSSNTANRAAATAPAETRTQSYDPLLDLPPLPQNKVSLMGGTVVQLDGVLNRITVLPFGSKQQMHLAFDVRSQIERDGKPAAAQDIRPGERVYIDSMLDGARVFAKTIRIRTSGSNGNGQGQVLSYDARSQILTLRDELSDQEVHFSLSPTTVIRSANETRSPADLKPGSLVSLDFSSQQGADVVHEISLLAEPGAVFSFFGRITFVDLSRKLIAVDNQSDGKTYEIYMPSIAPGIVQGLHEGSQVSVSAVFDGTQYAARSLTPVASSQRSDQ